MTQQLKFTKKTLDALAPDVSKREREFACSEVAGLRFVVSKRQKKSWLLRYTLHGHKRSMKIGEYPTVNIDEARWIQMPDRSLLRIEQMARVSLHDHGVGVRDERSRMLSWIECNDPDKREAVAAILLEVMNSPRRAKQPDWRFLHDGEAVSQAAVPAEPQMHALVPPRRQSAVDPREAPSSPPASVQTSLTSTSGD